MASPEKRSPLPDYETEQLNLNRTEPSTERMVDSSNPTTNDVIAAAKVERMFSAVAVTPLKKTANVIDSSQCDRATATAPASGEDSRGSPDSSYGRDDITIAKDPFSPECKIPLPVTFAPFDFGWVEPSFIRKRNERERQRVRNVNDGFERLRLHLPLLHKAKNRRFSKVSRVETLRYAINYIRHLQAMLKD